MKILKISILFIFFITVFSLPILASAQTGSPDPNAKCLEQHTDPDSQAYKDCVAEQNPSDGSLQNPLGKDVTSISQVYGRIIYAFLGMAGAVALIMFIMGGFFWMTAAGNEEKVTKGKQTLLWAVLGLIVIFSSYAILRTIFASLKFN